VNPDIPYRDIPKELRDALIHGTPARRDGRFPAEFEGVIPNCTRRFHKTTSEYVKSRLLEYMSELPCPTAAGRASGGNRSQFALAARLSMR